jgi:uncharacterized protein (TIGR02246 family)
MVRLMGRMAGSAMVLALAACAGMEAPATAGSAEDEAAIRGVLTQWGAAYSARDAAGIAALVTENYEEVMPDGRHIQGRAALQAAVAEELGMIPAEVSITLTVTTDFLHWIGADAAAAGGSWTVTGAPEGSGPSRGSWLGVLRRDTDGQWRMANGLGSAYVPPAAPPTPAG